MTDDLAIHGIVHARSQAAVDAAYRFARDAHGDQKRKYTGEPYINHPVEVAQIVATVSKDIHMIMAALLHDVLEDTPVTFSELRDAGFGWDVAFLVWELSDISKPEDGNRATRKALDRMHISRGSKQAKTVKLADLISNTKSIVKHDPDFAKVYMKEKTLLLPHLNEGNLHLAHVATSLVEEYYDHLSRGEDAA